MFGRFSDPSGRIGTLIGKSSRIQGDVAFAGGLHLDGRVNGNVRAEETKDSMLSVSESGCIEGSIEAAVVIVHGVVRGDIRASERLMLGATARVQGSVFYGLIESATGAEITGKLVPLAAGPVQALQIAAAHSFDRAAGPS
jgi:cytoskeletal protein CcmA (bactofilin family)